MFVLLSDFPLITIVSLILLKANFRQIQFVSAYG